MNVINIRDYSWYINISEMSKEERNAVLDFLNSQGYSGFALDMIHQRYCKGLTNADNGGMIHNHIMWTGRATVSGSRQEIKFNFENKLVASLETEEQKKIRRLEEIIANAQEQLNKLRDAGN